MALIWYEHFDLYGSDPASNAPALEQRGYVYNPSSAAASGIRADAARNGGFGFRSAAALFNVSFIRRTFASPYTTMGQGVGFRPAGAPSFSHQHNQGIRFGTAADNRFVAVVMGPDFRLDLYLGSTLIASSANNVFVPGVFSWLEAKAVSGEGSGSVEVRVQGITVLSATGLNLPPLVHASLGIAGDSGNNTNADYDDWVVWDGSGSINNNWMGDTFVLVAAPTADGTPSQWTPNSGTNRFSRVNTASPDDSTFISASNTGDAQEFTHSPLNLPVGAVAAIAVQTRAFKPDAGASEYRLGLASGSATGMSDVIPLTTGTAAHSHIQNVDPATGLPWTQSAAQAARLRVQRA